ncbi:MAG TPA: S8 family peptidase [Acidimicrobiales bacterium]|nr:S8 family peptidase [Acidimicrobiales bacterium]
MSETGGPPGRSDEGPPFEDEARPGPPPAVPALDLGAHVVDTLLLGAGGRRRELQDFPVLGDVWSRFADVPGKAHDLLITPTWEKPTGTVATLVATAPGVVDTGPRHDRQVAYLQDLVVARLSLDDLTAIVFPATTWWDGIEEQWVDGPPDDETLAGWISRELRDALSDEQPDGRLAEGERPASGSTMNRQVAKLGLMLGVLRAAAAFDGDKPAHPTSTVGAAVRTIGRDAILDKGVEAIRLIIDRYADFAESAEPANGLIFQVSLNRIAAPAIVDSVSAIKADAAVSLFSITCAGISWAILDSGIDQGHPAFIDWEKVWKKEEKAARIAKAAADKRPATPSEPSEPSDGAEPSERDEPLPHRIKATFDFRDIRSIMSVDASGHRHGADHDNDDDHDADDHESAQWQMIERIVARTGLDHGHVDEQLGELAEDRTTGKRIDWAKVMPLIKHVNPEPPPHPHGTHVAGILGARWFETKKGQIPKKTDPVEMAGVCPDISLYDFRVLGSGAGDTEFAVIAALQFIRFLNDQSGYSLIDGVNMSLSIPHNVRNYACGRTQVCVEAESLVSNGVVVVAAAGNRGFQQYRLADNTMFESYAASSITDPGNAESVITVGATHRHWPHTYGVSFFSSRGPTGDGRLKPDLLAPGEKITSCIPHGGSDRMDGTSMAAPHVSGAAALLMARYEELKGQPHRIKQILCDTATDLNRERSFQGYGMVDVLRAIQSI